MVVASFYGLKERREEQMYRAILIWTASFIVSGLIAGKTSFAFEVNSSEGTNNEHFAIKRIRARRSSAGATGG